MSNTNWEVRAKERRIENKALKKRIKELTTSRDLWKAKYIKAKDSLTTVQTKVEIVKKNIQRIINV